MSSPTGGSTAADASPRNRAPGGLVWTVMMVVWYLLGWPMGPDGPIHRPTP